METKLFLNYTCFFFLIFFSSCTCTDVYTWQYLDGKCIGNPNNCDSINLPGVIFDWSLFSDLPHEKGNSKRGISVIISIKSNNITNIQDFAVNFLIDGILYKPIEYKVLFVTYKSNYISRSDFTNENWETNYKSVITDFTNPWIGDQMVTTLIYNYSNPQTNQAGQVKANFSYNSSEFSTNFPIIKTFRERFCESTTFAPF